jgi:hypothetical protein
MSLVKCGECGAEISDKSKKCVKCGAPIKKNVGCLIPVLTALITFVVFMAIGIAPDNSNKISVVKKTITKEEFDKQCGSLFHNYSRVIPWGSAPDLDSKIEALQKEVFNNYLSSLRAQGYSIKNPNYNNAILMAMFLSGIAKGVKEREQFLENNAEYSQEACYIDGQERIKNMNARVWGQLAPIATFNEGKQGCKKDGCFFVGHKKWPARNPTQEETNSILTRKNKK